MGYPKIIIFIPPTVCITKSMIFNQNIWKFLLKCLLWPNKSNTQTKVGGTLKIFPLAAKPPDIRNLKRWVFELTTSFWLHRFYWLPEKKMKFFYLCLAMGSLGQNFKSLAFFISYLELLEGEKSRFSKILDFLKMTHSQKFWRHWPARFFTTCLHIGKFGHIGKVKHIGNLGYIVKLGHILNMDQVL